MIVKKKNLPALPEFQNLARDTINFFVPWHLSYFGPFFYVVALDSKHNTSQLSTLSLRLTF